MMGNKQLLCYKLCYCLGVATEDLMARYPHVYTAIERGGHFSTLGKDVKSYRCLTRIYFLLIRHYNLYRKVRSIYDVSGDRLNSYLNGIDFDPDEVFKASTSLCACLNTLAVMANNYLPQVYTEMEIGLPFSEFLLLTQFPQLKEQDIIQIQFMLKKVPSTCNIYFFSSPVFNVDLPGMLRSDTALVKRLTLVTGPNSQHGRDTSTLAMAMKGEDDKAFLRLEDIPTFDYVFMDNAAVPIEIKNILPTLFEDRPDSYIWCPNRVKCFQALTDVHTPQNSLLITHCYDTTLDKMVDMMEHISFLLTMPLPHATYYRALQRSWPNTYLLSIKNSKVQGGKTLV